MADNMKHIDNGLQIGIQRSLENFGPSLDSEVEQAENDIVQAFRDWLFWQNQAGTTLQHCMDKLDLMQLQE